MAASESSLSSSYHVSTFDKIACGELGLLRQSEDDIAHFLPFLVLHSHANTATQRHVWKLLCGMPKLSTLSKYATLDWASLCETAKDEVRAKFKASPTTLTSPFDSAIEFENSDDRGKMRILLSELYSLIIRTSADELATPTTGSGLIEELDENTAGVLFSSDLYTDELVLALPILIAKASSIINFTDSIKALVRTPRARSYVVSIIHNTPHAMHSAIEALLDVVVRAKPTSRLVDTISAILLDLCGCSHAADLDAACRQPSRRTAAFVRSALLQRRQLSEVILLLTHRCLGDGLAFVVSLLADTGGPSNQWFRDYLVRRHDDGAVATLRQHAVEIVSTGRHPTAATAEALKLLCGLAGVVGVPLKPSECEAVLSAACGPMVSTSTRLARLLLGFLLVVRGLAARHRSGVDTAAAALFGGQKCAAEFLLVAVHCHARQLAPLGDVIRTVIGLPVGLHAESVAAVAEVVVALATEEAVARAAVALCEVRPMSTSTPAQTAFGAAAVFAMLKGGVFAKYGIDARDWLRRQIRAAAVPLHPLLPALVDAAAVAAAAAPHVARFSEDELQKEFLKDNNKQYSEAGGVLWLFYVLCVNRELAPLGCHGNGAWPRPYPAEFVAGLPVRRILAIAQQNAVDYDAVLPTLTALAAAQLPQLCSVTMATGGTAFAESEGAVENYGTDYVFFTEHHRAILAAAFTEIDGGTAMAAPSPAVAMATLGGPQLLANPDEALCVLLRINALSPVERQLPYMDAVVAAVGVMATANQRVPQRVVLQLSLVWESLYNALPWQLGLATINALCSGASGSEIQRNTAAIGHTELIADPLLALRFDALKVMRYPAVVAMVTRILATYLVASRHHLMSTASVATANGATTFAEEANCLLQAQESSVVQLILELCVALETAAAGPEPAIDAVSAAEARTQLFGFVHQLFIDNPLVMKLVHFQTYPIAAIPLAVAGIPSMHYCLEFLPEMLTAAPTSAMSTATIGTAALNAIAAAAVKRQLFAIRLAGFIIEKYPIPKSLAVARQVLATVRALHAAAQGAAAAVPGNVASAAAVAANAGDLPTAAVLLPKVLPAVEQIGIAFPSLLEEITVLMLDLCPPGPPQPFDAVAVLKGEFPPPRKRSIGVIEDDTQDIVTTAARFYSRLPSSVDQATREILRDSFGRMVHGVVLKKRTLQT